MRARAEIVSLLMDSGLIAVVRLADPAKVLPVCEALVGGGISTIEITATIPDFTTCIRRTREALGGQAVVGAGSIHSLAQCQAALAAGAEFIVTPILRLPLIQVVHELDRPILVGAFTPTEAQIAHEYGADFVKIFPADQLGPSYFRAVRGPLPHLRLVPTGGITLENVRDYFGAGCALVGLGSNLIPGDFVLQDQWENLTSLARQWVAAVQEARINK